MVVIMVPDISIARKYCPESQTRSQLSPNTTSDYLVVSGDDADISVCVLCIVTPSG